MSPYRELSGHIPIDYLVADPCAWCGVAPAEALIWAEGLGREVPMHPTCGMAMMYAYRRWLRGALKPGGRSSQRIVAMLGPSPAQLAPGPVVVDDPPATDEEMEAYAADAREARHG